MFSKVKIILLLCICAIISCPVGAATDALLKNADCSELSPFNLPVNWEIRTTKTDGFKAASGVITLDTAAGASEVFLIQRNLPLTADGKYELRYSVKGQGEYRAYVEYATGQKMASLGATWQKANADWQERWLGIALKPEASQAKLVFHVRTGGKIELRGISLIKADSAVGRNLNFAQKKSDGAPLAWNVRGGEGAVTCENGMAVLKKTTGAAPFLIQTPLNMTPPQNYRFSVEVMGSKDAKYRFYLEEVMAANKRKAFGRTSPQSAPSQWTTVYFDAVPEKADSLKQLVLNHPADTGEVRFRNLKIAPVGADTPAPAAGAALTMLNVPVKLNGSSKVSKNLDGTAGATVAYVSNYVPGAIASGFKVEPGKYYELEYQVKGEGKASNSTGIMHFFDVRVDLKDGSEQLRSTWDDVMSHGFVPKKFVFKVPEKHKGTIDIGMGVTEGSVVTFLLTSLKEKTFNPAENMRLVITSPAYANGIFETKPVAEVAGFVEARTVGGKAEFKVLRDGKVLAERTQKIVDGKADFSFDAAIFRTGGTQVECRIFDAAGKELKQLSQIITRYPRSKGNEVVIGQDKQFYVNGKLFFPIVQYGMRPDDLLHTPQTDIDTVGYVSRGGSNVFIFSPKSEADALRILDLLVENNSMAMLHVGFWRGQATRENVERWGHGICNLLTPKVVNHPGFFGFYFADEPRWNGVPAINLQLSADVLKKITPYHPTHIVAAPRGSVEDHLPYAAVADYYGIDIYPVPAGSHSNLDDRTLTSVGKYTQRAAAMVEHRKPVLMTLQAFAWGELSKRALIYPTLAESRFMAYDALLNGGTHIGYYSLRHVVTPEFVDVINAVTLELHRMSHLLTSGKVIADRLENDIHYRVIEFNHQRYVIALNTKQEPRKAVIKAGFKNAKVDVLEEKRQLAVVNGNVEDDFPPFGVRVYAEAPLPPPLGKLPSGTVKNPWVDYAKQKNSVTFYQGKANWIWDKTVAGKAMSEVYLSKQFELKKPVKAIRMLASADNMAKVWLNGKEIGKVDDWEFMTELNLTAAARPGMNLLSVFAADGAAPPCAFLADIDIQYQDGSTEKIMTDGSWRCSAVKVKDWMTPEVVDKQFKKVDFVVPYGGGRWANRMKLK